MPAHKITRKRPSSLARTVRKATPAPRFTRIQSNVDLVVPPDCDVSVILKEVGHDDHRCYAWWLLVGRCDRDTMQVPYKYTGEDTLRCDIPSGTPLSAASLQPYLAKFLKGEGTQDDIPPVIKT